MNYTCSVNRLSHSYARFQIPCILVGNKIDLRGGEVTNEALEEEIVPIMNEFKVNPFLIRRVELHPHLADTHRK